MTKGAKGMKTKDQGVKGARIKGIKGTKESNTKQERMNC